MAHTQLTLELVPTDALLAELGRRVRGHQRGHTVGDVSATVSAPDPVHSGPGQDRREYWRRSKAAWRARKRAEATGVSADSVRDVRTVVVVDTKEQQQQQDRVSALSADTRVSAPVRIPGLEHTGPAPEPEPAGRDDLRRRRLRAGVADILARAELTRQQTAGQHISNPGGWLRTVSASIAMDRAADITRAVETALARWPEPTPTHVAELLAATTTVSPAAARRAIPHIPVDLPAPEPQHRSLEALAAVRNALRTHDDRRKATAC